MPQHSKKHVITKRIEPYRLSERVLGKLLFLLAWPTLVVAMRRRSRRTELWIGDSHAMSVNRKISNSMFMRAPEGQLILRAGARLIYSLADKGFPPNVLRVARFVNRFGRPGALVPIFSAGEIDIRVHLPKRLDDDFDFVAGYVAQCMEVARVLKADRVGFLVPTPPVDVPEEDVWFPIGGTLEERLAAHRKVRDGLAAAVERTPGAVLLDFTDDLVGPSGGMPVELTTDGAHTNAAAVARIRARIGEYGLLAD
ncbi:MAG TPA: hypothetical protein VFZ89_07055 [Solirubrobacteraceae bacterium]